MLRLVFASSTATRCWRRSWDAMIFAHATPASDSRSAASSQAAFDGVNRDGYFFAAAVRTAQAEFDKHQPEVVVNGSRGGAVATNIDSGIAKIVLLCSAWKKYGTARTVKPGTAILHSRADDVIPFADSEELVRNSRLPVTALTEIGSEHRLADEGSLAKMLEACQTSREAG